MIKIMLPLLGIAYDEFLTRGAVERNFSAHAEILRRVAIYCACLQHFRAENATSSPGHLLPFRKRLHGQQISSCDAVHLE